jgi:hypothetical protein
LEADIPLTTLNGSDVCAMKIDEIGKGFLTEPLSRPELTNRAA